tara:strand:- start:43 stop:546 length:504 start_codon:yes stop_codon:yes gene_type:complete
MDNLKKIVLRSIARNVCRLTGSKKPYRKIRGLARKSNKDFLKSNCHGFTLYMLGFGENPELPRFADHYVMDGFLTDYCYESQKGNGLIVAFREGDETLAHTGIICSTHNDPILIHQPDKGIPFKTTTLDRYLEENPLIRTETSIEFYKYFPDNRNLPVYGSRFDLNV